MTPCFALADSATGPPCAHTRARASRPWLDRGAQGSLPVSGRCLERDARALAAARARMACCCADAFECPRVSRRSWRQASSVSASASAALSPQAVLRTPRRRGMVQSWPAHASKRDRRSRRRVENTAHAALSHRVLLRVLSRAAVLSSHESARRARGSCLIPRRTRRAETATRDRPMARRAFYPRTPWTRTVVPRRSCPCRGSARSQARGPRVVQRRLHKN